jgi:hypothetical protein
LSFIKLTFCSKLKSILVAIINRQILKEFLSLFPLSLFILFFLYSVWIQLYNQWNSLKCISFRSDSFTLYQCGAIWCCSHYKVNAYSRDHKMCSHFWMKGCSYMKGAKPAKCARAFLKVFS